jgi:hypothetical protein
MDPKFFRKYADIVESAEKDLPVQQLDEGLMDTLQAPMKKLANAIMSKLDPQTLQGLQQAYKASGGDRNKMMATIGITQQDLAPLAKQAQPGQVAPVHEDWNNSSLKGKILTVLMNVLPLTGVLDLLSGGHIGFGMMGNGIMAAIWYVVSAALVWGCGHYDFTDNANAEPGQAPAKGGLSAGMGQGNF